MNRLVVVLAAAALASAPPTFAGEADDLIAAAARNDINAIDRLLEAGVAPGVERGGTTPLVAAIVAGHYEAVERLLDADYSLAARPAGDSTPLHLAVENGRPRLVRALLDRGGFPLMEDGDGQTPLQRAERNGDEAVVAMLTVAERELRALVRSWSYDSGDGIRVTYDIRSTAEAVRTVETPDGTETLSTDVIWYAYNRIGLETPRDVAGEKRLERLICRRSTDGDLDCGLQYGWTEPVIRFRPAD